MFIRPLSLLLILSGLDATLSAQTIGFEKVTTGPLVTTTGDSLGFAWGDLDGDGDDDVLVSNGLAAVTSLQFRNDGEGSFAQVTSGPLAVDPGNSDDVILGDIDNDGDLDVFVARRAGGNNALYRNQGGAQLGVEGNFIKAFSEPEGSDGGDSRAAAFGDIDGDGDLDLFVANASGQNDFLYRNLGGAQGGAIGTFVKTLAGAPVTDGANGNDCAFADVDGDGDLDLFVANGSNQNNALFMNGGGGTFTKLAGAAPVNDGGDSHACAFGDLDGDGDLDLVVGNLLQPTNVYLNQGFLQGGAQGSFVRVTTGALQTTSSATNDLALGDYDKDGDLDLALADCCTAGNALYQNTGSGGQFLLVTTGPVAADAAASNAVGFHDYDGDGDLDLFVANSKAASGNSMDFLYRNSGPATFSKINDGPLASDIAQHVDAALGDYDGDGDLDVFIATSNDENNALYRNEGGTQGGTEGTFTQVLTGALIGDGGDTWGAAWGDMDRDGDLDLATADRLGLPNGNNGLYRNLGGGIGVEGNFFKETSSPVCLAGGTSRDVAWADMDNDGDLDLVFANSNGEHNFVYRNKGGAQGGAEGSFESLTTTSIAKATGENYGLAWGDKDSDGDLDLFIANRAGNNFLFTNAGGAQPGFHGSFVQETTGPVVNDGGDSFAGAWGDMDNDGDLDLFVSNGSGNNFLYTNLGFAQGGVPGTFARVTSGPVATDPAASRQAAWQDIDGDGDLDLFVPNASGADNFLYVNDGAASFTRGTGVVGADGGNSRDAEFGDLDGDGDADLVVANQGEAMGFYRNENPKAPNPLVDLGFALAGVHGAPVLHANGTLLPGSPLAFFVVNAKGSAATGFFVGISAVNAPFKGGTFVPAPGIVLAVPTDPTGFYSLPTTWPAAIPGGFQTWYQAWIPDSAGVKGFSATNAIVGTAP